MNTKVFYSIIIAALLTSHSGKAEDYQLPFSNADIPGTYSYFSRTVFPGGVRSFLKDIFNSPAYAEEFLPNNFTHMVEFLHHGNQTGKDQALYEISNSSLFK